MQKGSNFSKQKRMKQIQTLYTLLKQLPVPAIQYLQEKEDEGLSFSTRIAYAYDLITFFSYLQSSNPVFKNIETHQFTIEHLQNLELNDFKEYRRFLSGTELSDLHNENKAIARKFAPVRGMFQYLYNTEQINANPASQLKLGKIKKQKTTIYMETTEIAALLDGLSTGHLNMSAHQRVYFEKTKLRDIAIMYILLGTGIRASECQGLDISDFNFRDNCFPVIRKGGELDMIYFNDQVKEALLNYINGPRSVVTPKPGHEEALFLSLQNRRISIDAIEKLVSKYTKEICTNKKITPHKLRSTFGTLFYKASGYDLLATQNAMGHENPNTTQIYIGGKEEDKKKARNLKL